MILNQFETALLYVFLIILLFFFSTLSEKRHNYFWTFVGIILLSIVIGFRDQSVGKDTITYAELFEKGYFTWIDDIGFVYLTSFAKRIMDVHWYLFLITFFTYFFLTFGLWKMKEKIPFNFAVLFFVIGFFFSSLNTIRQMLSTSIIIYGVHYLFSKKYLRYLIVCGLAALIHISGAIALLGLVYLFISNWKSIKSSYRVLYVTVFSILLLGVVFFLYRYASASISNKFGSYFASTKRTFGLFGLFACISVSFICYMYGKKEKKTQDEAVKKSVIAFSLIAVFGSLIGYYFAYANRIFEFFTIFEYLLFSLLFGSGVKKYGKSTLFLPKVAALFLVIYPFVNILINDGYNAMNYIWGL